MRARWSARLAGACLVGCTSADTPADGETDRPTDTDTALHTDPPPLPAGTWRAELELLAQPDCELQHVEVGVEVDAPCDGCRAFRVEGPAPCDVPWLGPDVLRTVRWDGPGDLSAVLVLDPGGATPTVTANLRPARGVEGEATFAAVFDAFVGQGELRARVVGTIRFALD